ncbi:MAG: hypothetical protein JWQ32_3600 [Marmoricola sp.]|nr:hypothetical protein [Marmoricola sp.]
MTPTIIVMICVVVVIALGLVVGFGLDRRRSQGMESDRSRRATLKQRSGRQPRGPRS